VKGWDLRALVDTGSDSTLISSEAVEKLGLTREVKECPCRIITLGGVGALQGEVTLDCRKLTGLPIEAGVHVSSRLGRKYDIILGCDVMARAGIRCSVVHGKWAIKLGRKILTVEGMTPAKARLEIGSAERNPRWEQMRTELRKKLNEVFYHEGEPLTATGRARHRIELTSGKPVYVKPRRYPHTLMAVIKKKVEEMLKEGIIRHSTSEFNSPLWAVPKGSATGKEQDYRVVVDYRELNKRTVTEKYPLPRLEEMLDRMTGAAVFSTLDLKSGYHQILMDERDIPKTAFTFERGHYEFVRMPFGLKNAPITFQRIMDEFLTGLEPGSVQIYMDDIIVFSPDVTTHVKQLERVIERVKEFGFKISADKTVLLQPRVKFMGHIVSKNGVEPDPEKVEAIGKLRVPETVKEVRSLLGALGYYRKFIKNFAEITEPLTALTRKNCQFCVDERVRKSVEQGKQALSGAPVLTFPDLEKPFVITTDASQVALGAVLSQEKGGEDKPVAFASRKLTDPETRYSAIERELLGIVWAIEQFRPYVYGTEFLLRTDHMPLLWLHTLKETSSRVSKWKEKLAGYNFKVAHVKGRDNVIADLLSRYVGVTEIEGEDGESRDDEVTRELVRIWEENDRRGRVSPDRAADDELTRTLVRIWEANDRRQRAQPEEGSEATETPRIIMERSCEAINGKRNQVFVERGLQDLISSENSRYGPIRRTKVKVGPEADWVDVENMLNQILHRGKVYHILITEDCLRERIIEGYETRRIGNGAHVVLYEKQVETVEDRAAQVDLIWDYHLGKTNHRGSEETTARLKRGYYWLNMERSVRETLKKCKVCGLTKYDRNPYRPAQEETPTPTRPGETMEADIFFYDREKFLTSIDLFSKRAAAVRINDKSGKSTREALLKTFAITGCPKRLVVDCGREFRNEQVQGLCEEIDVELHFTTPGHVGSHGTIERFHSTLTEHLHLLEVGRSLRGEEAIDRAVLAYNHSIHSTSGETPIEGVNGENTGEVRERIVKKKETRTRRFNENRAEDMEERVKVGDIIFTKNSCKRRKTDKRFLGPFRVIRLLPRKKVELQKVGEPSRKITAHLKEVKRK
jgi:transposase InsO family protein